MKSDSPSVFLVWAAKKNETRLWAVCTTREIAEHYRDCFPYEFSHGFGLYVEEAPLDHAFGLNDGIQAIALGVLSR